MTHAKPDLHDCALSVEHQEMGKFHNVAKLAAMSSGLIKGFQSLSHRKSEHLTMARGMKAVPWAIGFRSVVHSNSDMSHQWCTFDLKWHTTLGCFKQCLKDQVVFVTGNPSGLNHSYFGYEPV